MLKNAPHTHRLLLGDWKHPYSKEKAFFPLKGYVNDKYWPPVARVDNVFGDRNLVSWGAMLADAQSYLGIAWWISIFPGLAIGLLIFAMNLLGDGLADAWNVRSAGRS